MMRTSFLATLLVTSACAVACGGNTDSGLGKATGGSGGSGNASGGSGNAAGSGGSGNASGSGGSGNVGGDGGTGNVGGDGGTGNVGGDGGTGNVGGDGGSGNVGGTGGSGNAGGTGGSGNAGGTGGSGNAGGTGGSGNAGGTGGSDGGTITCADLEKAYATSLAAAKACNPILSVLQCTKSIGDELACPCPTYVNPSNTTAMAELAKLQSDWTAHGCDQQVVCPLVLCAQPGGAACTPQSGGSVGVCKDVSVN